MSRDLTGLMMPPPPTPVGEFDPFQFLMERLPPESKAALMQKLMVQQPQIPQGAGQMDPTILKKQSREQRMQRYRNLLQDVTFSLGAGLAEAARAPGGRRNRTMAGMGAALQAPLALTKAREQFESNNALEKQRLAQAERLGEQTRQDNLKVPAQIEAILAQAGVNQARVPQIQAQTQTELQRPANVAADTALKTANAAAAKFKTTQQGLYDIEKNEIVPGTGPNDRIEITEEIVKAYGLPEGLIGEHLKSDDIARLIKKPNARLVTLEDGVYEYDLTTGEKKKIGPRPVSAQTGMVGARAVVDPTTNTFIGWQTPHGFLEAPLQGTALSPTPQATMTRNELFNDILRKLDVLEMAAKKHPLSIGGAKGVIGTGASILSDLAILNDDERNSIYQLSDDLSDQRLRARSGAAINPDELRRITRFSPNATSQTSSQFFNNIRQMRSEVEAMLKQQPARTPAKTPTTASPSKELEFVRGPSGSVIPKPSENR